jgi:dihydroflavonol-4-reductase
MATPKVTPPRGLVAVTGGSGYVAGYCIAQLLNEGWRVRTTVRNLGAAEEVRATIGKITPNAGAMEFVAADLNSDVGWAEAVAGADYVLHVASPVPTVDPKSDDELVRPARDGTLRVLRAAREAGVKRVVMTSSISAIMFGRGVREKPFTEADWTDETNRADTSPYDRAKTIAERAAWAWHKAEGGGLELVTVNPGLVLGPVLGSDFSASLEAVRKLLDGSVPALPHFGFNVLDVRDVAALQLLAMTTPSAAGQRFIGSCDFYWMADIAKILKQGLGDKARKVPSIPVPDFLIRVVAIFDPVARGRLYELGKPRKVSSEKARRTLGWTTRPARETVLDTARSLQAQSLA